MGGINSTLATCNPRVQTSTRHWIDRIQKSKGFETWSEVASDILLRVALPEIEANTVTPIPNEHFLTFAEQVGFGRSSGSGKTGTSLSVPISAPVAKYLVKLTAKSPANIHRTAAALIEWVADSYPEGI